ncbi:hypothetical protein ACFQ2M_27455 [Kitasatospora saccharophila]|uniref:hypothetical protein n=1 Tax=Kitasatospora saccharophila TaxID=407973 RepID=UPI00363A1310
MTTTTTGARREGGRWFLRSAARYLLLFAGLWFGGGGLVSLLATGEASYTSTQNELGLIDVGLVLFCVVGIPSLVIIPLVGRLRKRESFRPVATIALLLPVLLLLMGEAGRPSWPWWRSRSPSAPG